MSRLKTDTPHNGLRLTLGQCYGDPWITIAFASRFLNRHEMKNLTNEPALLKVICAAKHFKYYPYGSEFEILTDLEALLSALIENQNNKTLHSRLNRCLNQLLLFNFTTKHISGREMGFNDLLSRFSPVKALPVSHYDKQFGFATII